MHIRAGESAASESAASPTLGCAQMLYAPLVLVHSKFSRWHPMINYPKEILLFTNGAGARHYLHLFQVIQNVL